MKRFLIALLLIFSIVICLPSCQQPPVIEENPEFDRFNSMFAQGFENYTITVSTTSPNGQVVNKKYVITTVNGERSISYEIETLNPFVIIDGVLTAPKEYKTVESGTYNNDLATQGTFDVPKFTFSYRYIENDMIIPGRFIAKIIALDGFTGLDIKSSEAKFTLDFAENAPKSMQITYVSKSNNTVVVTYTFN